MKFLGSCVSPDCPLNGCANGFIVMNPDQLTVLPRDRTLRRPMADIACIEPTGGLSSPGVHWACGYTPEETKVLAVLVGPCPKIDLS